MKKRSLLTTLLALAAAANPCLGQGKLEFNRDVRPILSNACFHCHGPSVKKGGLRLDQAASAFKPARSEAVPIVPAKPGDSEVIRRIFASDDTQMPPKSSHKTLKAAEKDLIKAWIAQGAPYQNHWSLEPPAKAEIPAANKHPIDAFLLARLQRERLQARGVADRPTLIRRVAFTLTGLPPTNAEVDAFVSDTDANAYEKMVDRYLGSKQFGEEMARHWLDVVRYADTHGLHFDNERQMWLYRDWVIKAFNDNLPFDQFTIDQLAGDLLPSPTRDQMIATGFNRCNVSTHEGGSIEAEWIYRNAVDRTSTMMSVWLGLTGECAVCHDHKFDPLTSKDYYSLYAFFLSAAGPALDGNALLTDPVMRFPTKEQEKRQAELAELIPKVQKEIAERTSETAYDDPADAQPEGSEAKEPRHSFRAWLGQKGQGDKNLPKDLAALLKQPKLTEDATKKLRSYYLQYVCARTMADFAPLTQQLTALTKEQSSLNAAVPGTFVFRELPKARDSFVMLRGQYNKPGEKVEPNTPAALPPLTRAGERATRLDLARWLLSAEQPLTTRVTVNRFWQQVFGIGLVKTSADFGAQGEPPSHPELLDFLAVHFRESGWDVKALLRLMVTSEAFKRQSQIDAELYRRDPENRLLARGPRLRLDAEQIRDNALYVSGLIDLQPGGRGVRPYQPPRIWEPVAFTGSNTMNYVQDKGPALYRRSIYVFFKRTAPAPFMANFDAPNRESSCSRRERSNTPLQALQLMNDVQHFEAARALAQRMLVEGGKSEVERITFAFRTVLARAPEPTELTIVQRTLQEHLQRYQADVASAEQVVRVGESQPRADLNVPELAAYTLVANLILNLDETVTRN